MTPSQIHPDPPGKLPKTAAYYAGFICLGFVIASLGPTLGDLGEQTGTRLSSISYLFPTRSLGYLLGSLLLGRLYDRFPGHALMGSVLLAMAAMMALVPTVPILWLLAAVMFILGLSEGTLDVGGNTLLVRIHPRNLGPYMNALHFFFGVGATVTPLIIDRAVTLSGGITWAYWTLALMIFPVGLLILLMPSPKIRMAPRADATGDGNPRLIFLVAACLFTFVGAEVGIGYWIVEYVKNQHLADATAARQLNAAFWGTFTLGRMLAIPISARWKPQALLFTAIFGAMSGTVLMLLWPVSLSVIWAGTCIAGLFIAPLYATLLTFAQTRITITGRVTGWFFVGASLGGMTIPWLIGQFFESAGPTIALAITMADLLIALCVFALLFRYSNRLKIRSETAA